MTVQRLEHIGIVVDDLTAATAFFAALGLEVEGERPSRAARWTAYDEFQAKADREIPVVVLEPG